MIILHRISFFIFVLSLLLTSCRNSTDKAAPVGGGILTPLTESSGNADSAETSGSIDETQVLPLVNPGENYNILILLDGNLDLEQSDEQVIIAIPLDDINAPLQLLIAATNAIRNEYAVVWSRPLTTRTLTGITLRAEDLTGNGRLDLVIAGFDEHGDHVTEVFAVPKTGELENFTKVFSLTVDGNIDIVTHDRSPGYWSGLSAGNPFPLIVQKSDPDSENTMDILETDWKWDSASFSYRQGVTRKVAAENIQEERIAKVYTSGVEPYEDYLKGAWYRESGSDSSTVMLYFDPLNREVMFYDGSIQEIFSWGKSHRATAKRLYARIINSVIPSMFETMTVSAEDWDTLELWRTSAPWNGTYKRLGPELAGVINPESEFKSLLFDLPLTGVWRSSTGTEIVFELPRIEWREGNKVRNGTATLFALADDRVLEVQFMKKNGAMEESASWLIEYKQEGDSSRIIRSISLTPAYMSVSGIRPIGQAPLYFEQIEIVSASE